MWYVVCLCYLTRVNVLKLANLFQSRNKIKLRHLCNLSKLFFQKHVLLVSHLSLLLCCVFIVLRPSSCYVRANIDIECLYLSLYHCNALVYENTESWILNISPSSIEHVTKLSLMYCWFSWKYVWVVYHCSVWFITFCIQYWYVFLDSFSKMQV